MSLFHKISKAKAKLLVDYPYFGTVASRVEIVLNDNIQTFKSDGVKLEYNADFFSKLELSEMEFVFANAAMHASLAHQQRRNNRSGWLWQLATDYAINDMLVANGLDRPWQAHYSKRFCGLYAEEIYAELKADILRDELEYETDDLDDVEENKTEENKTQKQELTQDDVLAQELFEEFSKSILEIEAKKHQLPDSIERFFKIESCGAINWRDALKSALDIFHKDDFTLLPPNKKFLHMGIYLPSCISNKFQVVIAVDSSGSVDENLLNKFLSEIDFLMGMIQNYQIELLVCDDKIHSHNTFYSGDVLSVDLKGFSGTSFIPVFEFIEDKLRDTKILLYFTDLDGKFPSKLPSYDVKWITSKSGDVPFGDVIVLEH